MNIANILTIFRLFLVPLFIYTFFNTTYPQNYFFAAGIFILAGITDVLDGYIARKFNMITDIGKLLDPLADKLMQLSALICVAVVYPSVRWALYVILIKELMMILGALFLYKKNVVVGANWYGKVATCLFYVSILSIMIFTHIGDFWRIVLMVLAVASALFAFSRYLIVYKHNHKV